MGAHTRSIVLDTNVLVSAVLFGGRPGRLLDIVRSGAVGGATSLHILGEFREVLTRPRFGIERGLAESLAVESAGFMRVVPVDVEGKEWTADPGDDPVIETALAGGAGVVVTGDRHLLRSSVPGLRMLTVAQMLHELE